MNKIINISIQNKIAYADKDASYVCGNSDFKVIFTFDDEWDGVNVKTARFVYEGKFHDVVFEGNECPVPVIIGTKWIDIGVFAGELFSSTPVRVKAKESILCFGDTPEEPSEDVYNQVIGLCEKAVDASEEAVDVANTVREDANNGKFNGVVNYSLVAGAIKSTVSGVGAVRIDDASSLQHNINLKVSRVNLLNSPFGEIHVENGKTYTFSFALKEGITYGQTYSIAWYNSEGAWNNQELINSEGIVQNTYTFTAGKEGYHSYHIDSYGFTEDMFKYVQLEEGSTATPYTPYIENLSSVGFKTYGKNLLDVTKAYARNNKDTIEVIDKDTIRWNGSYWFFLPISIPAGTTFRISISGFEVESGECTGFKGWYMLYEDDTYSDQMWGEYTAIAEKNIKALRISKSPAAGVATVVIKGYQVEIGDTKTEYEPYKEPVDGSEIVYPTTTIISDTAGVRIEAEYNVDTKKYIDNKFAELQALILEV